MFRLRRHTCKVVLVTSLAWCVLVILLLLTVNNERGEGGGGQSLRRGGGGKLEALRFAKQADPDKDVGRKSSFVSWQKVSTVILDSGMPGAGGKPVHIPKSREEERKEKFRINQFNLLASEMISLNRSLTDVRLSA